MKRILLALVVTMHSLSLFADAVIRKPITFAGNQVEQFGFIEVSSSFLLCGSFKIVPQKSKENTPIYLRATRSNKQIKSAKLFKKEFEPIWQTQKPQLTQSIKTGPSGMDDQTMYQLAFNTFIKSQIGDYFTTPNAVKLPTNGLALKFDGGPAFRIYVYTSPNLDENPVDPEEYVVVTSIKNNAPCVGALAPAESYEPLDLKNKLK